MSGYREDQILVKVIMLINACKINITQKSHKEMAEGLPEKEAIMLRMLCNKRQFFYVSVNR